MSSWEQRMSQRAHERTPDPLEAAARAARDKYIADHGEHHLSATPPPPEVESDVCRDCCEWRPIGNWPGVYAWFLACGPLGACAFGHKHHEDEIWLAAPTSAEVDAATDLTEA